MALITRIYFNAVFGGLGGLLGWMLFSIFANKTDDVTFFRLVVDGLFIGGGIGAFVVSVEALRDRSWLRFVRLACVGMLLGGLGGALGMCLAEMTNYLLVSRMGAIRESVLIFFLTVIARGLSFTLLGLFVGASEGLAARSRGKFSYGTLGGALGGFVGGCLFGLIYLLTLQSGGEASFAGAAGFVIMGASIGSLSALVQGVFQPASVKVLRGWQEGREYPLDKNDTHVGRDEAADIALFRDMRVEKQHVIIQRDGDRYLLLNNGAPPDFTRVNDRPVAQMIELHDDDKIQLGNVLLRFQRREAHNHPRPGRVPGATSR
jgi:hypothetical protein